MQCNNCKLVIGGDVRPVAAGCGEEGTRVLGCAVAPQFFSIHFLRISGTHMLILAAQAASSVQLLSGSNSNHYHIIELKCN